MPEFPSVQVVGINFRGQEATDIAAQLSPQTVLKLEREPDNPHDPNAIKVFFEDLWIGYIERGQALWIAPYMDDGESYVAEVDHVEEVTMKNGRTRPVPLVVVRPE